MVAHLRIAALALAVAACGLGVEPSDTAPARDEMLWDGEIETVPGTTEIVSCPVLVVGGGTGGTAAAIAAARTGASVCVTEQTDWLGGQLTAQGLNASDDNRYTDTTGATRTYLELRRLVRAASGGRTNPGSCWVSYLCATPRTALDAIDVLTKEARDGGRMRVFFEHVPESVQLRGGRVAAVTFQDLRRGRRVQLRARQTVDATELGDVVKLSGAGYRTGQEPRSDTGEADAPERACPECVQAFTYDVILEKRPEHERHVVARPEGYGERPWLKGFDHGRYPMFGHGGVWTYRRIDDGRAGGPELSVMNWGSTDDGNDYPFANVIDEDPATVALHLERARQRALAYVYWLQTEADGRGYPFLKLRDDLLGTDTGVAKHPYVRESRRLRALTTIRVEDISDHYVKDSRARAFPDSVGIGWYPIDLHQSAAEGSGVARGESLPFQVPLGALVPERVDGLLAGAKNIGTTHLTNGAYRLHPIEWAIGEAAGTFAALLVDWELEARAAYAQTAKVRALQDRLLADGAPLHWTDDVLPSDRDWRDIQLVGGVGIMRGVAADSLSWAPGMQATRAQAALALVRTMEFPLVTPDAVRFVDVPRGHWAWQAVETLVARGIVSGVSATEFAPDAPITRWHLHLLLSRSLGDDVADRIWPATDGDSDPLTRRELARALAAALRVRFGVR